MRKLLLSIVDGYAVACNRQTRVVLDIFVAFGR
jgi:hypothetical protein